MVDGSWQRSSPKLAASLIETRLELVDDLELSDGLVRGDVEVADADSVELVGCRFAGARMTGTTLRRAQLVDCVFESCELSGLTLEETRLNRVEFRDCRLLGVQLADARAKDVAFIDCRMDTANFRMATLERVEFERCVLVEADFLNAKMPGGRLHGCDLTRSQFTKADLRGASLRRSLVEGMKGADGLRRVSISYDQLVPLALAVFSGMGIAIVEDDDG